MSKDFFVSVIIPTRNRKELLRRVIDSLLKQNYPKEKYEIVVVDDGSTDGTEDMIHELRKRSTIKIRYYKQESKGPAAARNVGIKNAQGDIIAFTDDDCIADENWINEIITAFEKKEVLGVQGRTTTIPEDITPFTEQIINLHGGFFTTCNMAYKKEILVKLGGFDERYTFLNEDMDLAFDVLDKGNIVFEPAAIVIHPPRKVTAVSRIRKMKWFWSEFRLYNKHQRYYRQYKGIHPFYVLLINVGILSSINELIRFRQLILTDILLYLRNVMVLVIQRLYLLLLILYLYLHERKVSDEKKTSIRPPT